MNTQQLADHIVTGIYGRRASRRAARNLAEHKRQQDHTRPKMWIHAHINSRATHKPGELAELVKWSKDRPADLRDWHEYLNETRAMRGRA